MVKLGNNNIKDVRIGETPILTIYQGEDIIWAKKPHYKIIWNQLIKNGNFADGLENWYSSRGSGHLDADGSILITQPGASTGGSILVNNGAQNFFNYDHKFYVRATGKVNGASYLSVGFRINEDRGNSTENVNSIKITTEEYSTLSGIIRPLEGYPYFGIGSYRSGYPEVSSNVKQVMLIDLSLIYGIGNEPTTPLQFENDYRRWFGKDLTYEEYDKGSVRMNLMDYKIMWNQLVKNGNFAEGTEYWVPRVANSMSIAEDSSLFLQQFATGTTPLAKNDNGIVYDITHKYLIEAILKSTNQAKAVTGFRTSAFAGVARELNDYLGEEYQKIAGILSPKNTTDIFCVGAWGQGSRLSDTNVKQAMLFDLTMMYGKGNEPTTPLEFENDYKNWFGKELTYEEFDAGTLKGNHPYDSEIEYIEVEIGDNDSIIETNFIPNDLDVDFEIGFMPTGYEANYSIIVSNQGPGGNAGGDYYGIRNPNINNTNWTINYSTSDTNGLTIPDMTLNNRHDICINGTSRQVYIDGELSSVKFFTTFLTNTSNHPFYIFNRYTKGRQTYGRLYFFKAYKATELKLDLIPVRLGDTGYMYDKISGKLFGNSGTGKFILGPDL